MGVQLRFLNQSQATDNPVIAITCSEPPTGTPSVAWHVIRNIGPGSVHPFTYSSELSVAAGDSNGTYTAAVPAHTGDAFSVRNTDAGIQMVHEDSSHFPDAIEVINLLPAEKAVAVVYRDRSVCARSPELPPNGRYKFSFAPLLYIGRATTISTEGVATLATFAGKPMRINLQGVTSADIIMKGGGAAPLVFSVENINR